MTDQLPPISIYLAGPMDGITQKESQGWREELAKMVPPNVLLVSPAHAVIGTAQRDNAPALIRINYAMIRTCDGLLANLTGPGRGFGTIREIEFACHNQPTAVAGNFDDTLMTVGLIVCDTIEEALMDLIKEIVDLRKYPQSVVALMFHGEEPSGSD